MELETASRNAMQVLVRNTGTLLRAAETPRGKMRAPRFEPSSRPDVPGGLLEARLTTNGGAGAPAPRRLALEPNS